MSFNPNALVCVAVPFLVLAAVAVIFTVPSLLRRLRVRRRTAAMFAGPSRPGQPGAAPSAGRAPTLSAVGSRPVRPPRGSTAGSSVIPTSHDGRGRDPEAPATTAVPHGRGGGRHSHGGAR